MSDAVQPLKTPATCVTSRPGRALALPPLYDVRSKPRTAPWDAGEPCAAKWVSAYARRRAGGSASKT
eukprot:6001397-Prymnesium_polylepis.1